MLSADDKRKVGGSDVAKVCGVSPYGGPLSVYLRVVEGVEQEDSTPLRAGRLLEPAVRSLYEQETGAQVVPDVRLALPEPALRASLDGVARRSGRGRQVLEVKTAGPTAAARWGAIGTDAVPEDYLLQVTWYLGHALRVGAVDEQTADVAALVAGEFRVYYVAYDGELFGLLMERVERFWVDHVLARRPPEPTALPNDVAAIRSAYRKPTHPEHLDFKALPPQTQVVVEEYLRAYRAEFEAAERLAIHEARLKVALAGAPGVSGLPAELGKRIDWMSEGRGRLNPWSALEELKKTHDLAELLKRHTAEPNRPLRVY